MPDTIIRFNFKAEDVVNEGRTTTYNIDGIKEWLEFMPALPPMSEEEIVIFLIACKNDIEATKSCITCFYKYKAASPEVFSNRDMDTDELVQTHKIAKIGLCPQRTKKNYAVFFAGLKDTSYSNFFLEPQLKRVYILLDTILRDNPPDGLIAVIDMKGVGLMHITRLKLGTVRKFFQFLQEALPTQLRDIHILNASYVFDKVLVFLKPFMNKEIFDLIITHSSNSNMDEFYEKYIPKEMVPSDYGGDLPSVEELSSNTRSQCEKLGSYLDAWDRKLEIYKQNLC